VINSELEENGYEPVDVAGGDLEERYGEYDHNTDTVNLDYDHVENGDPASVLNTAFHETGHVMEDQDGDFSTLTADEQSTYNDVVNFEGYIDENGELGMKDTYNSYHEDVYTYADYRTNEVMDNGMSIGSPAPPAPPAPPVPPAPSSGAAGAESSSGDFEITIDWENVVIENEGDFEFTIDYDNAVVTP
jgi:hypothetical protein